MCGVIAGLITTSVGIVFLVAMFVVHYNVIPNVINSLVIDSTVLIPDTEQWERFEENPFPLKMAVYFFNITNPQEVLNGGVPVVEEMEPYHYKLYMKRIISNVTDDTVVYRRQEFLEFDAEASFPRTEQDEVTIANAPYQAILQAAEVSFPSLMPALSLATANIFGNEKNSPIATFKVEELLLKGYKLCENPGPIGRIACNQIRNIGGDAKNMELMDDGSILFSLIRYKHDSITEEYVASRGLDDAADLGAVFGFAGFPYLQYWPETAGGPFPNTEGTGFCNMINGTDSFIYNPFVHKEQNLHALNTDICRSVDLVYLRDSSYADIPSYVFASDEWFLANEAGCFCLNMTKGITREDGCLLKGAAELFSCTGGPLVLSSPHFLYADELYRNGVIGLTPDAEKHRIMLELEPYTGSPLKAAKRGQFNTFLRPINGIPATAKLNTTLTPIFWIEEGMELPDDLVQMIKDKLVSNLDLIDILVPVLFAVAAVVLAAGLGITGGYWYKKRNTKVLDEVQPETTTNTNPITKPLK